MGGGGFSMEPENPLLDEYVLSRSPEANPSVCLLPTASGDSDYLITRFYTAFHRLPCCPRHLSLFRQPVDLEKRIMDSDIIYVGGGNTRNMLAIWKSCGMDLLLRKAWESGIVLSGLSAGAICWFEEGHTDSTGTLGRLDCLGFLEGSCSPHYDGEVDRKPSYRQLLKQGKLSSGLALDDGAAALFIDKELAEIVTSRPQARAFRVKASDGDIVEESLPIRFLGEE